MRWLRLFLLKLGAILGIACSLYFFLFSPVTLKINKVHALAQNVIEAVVKQSGDQSLNAGLQLAKATGIEGQVVANLPQKLTFHCSYADLYRLSKNYQANKTLTAKDVGLTSNNRLQAMINGYLMKEINENLRQNKTHVLQLMHAYQNGLLIVMVFYLLAVLLILFGRTAAVWPLLLASGICFVPVWLLCRYGLQGNSLANNLDLIFPHGMWLAFGLTVIIVFLWPILLKKAKKERHHNA